jgi:hypothetical protein
MGTRQKFTQAQVIAALRETKGMVYLAAKRLGCEAQTIYNYRDRYPAVRAEMEQQDGEVDDAAEMKLYQAIIAGEPWAVQFRLRTKGKGRGYVERVQQEVSGPDGGPIQTEHVEKHDLSKLTSEQLRELRGLLAKAATDGTADAR